jgi:hypothetical protein
MLTSSRAVTANPPRMKNQPANRGPGETRIDLPGKKKPFNGAQ